ncbi:MAG: rhodanese-like domain-containing protein [Ignavibacteriaceae bacterium]
MDNRNKSIKIKLALIAIVFALLAAIAGSPYKITLQPVSTNEEFEIEGKSVKVIDVHEIAKWIMDKRDDFQLFDIRLKNEFDEYHIPFALSMSGTELPTSLIDHKSAVIIYNKTGSYSIKKIKPVINNSKEQIYVLIGGMDEWINKILFPDLKKNSNFTEKEIERIYKTSTYFGGKPILEKERPKRKYKREGC